MYELNGTFSGVTNTSTLSVAQRDTKGLQNTRSIVNQFDYESAGNNSTWAARSCHNYPFVNNEEGFLGAAGEWKIVYDNKEEIEMCATKIDFQPFGSNIYWTSTQSDDYSAWCIYMDTGLIQYRMRGEYHFAKPFGRLS